MRSWSAEQTKIENGTWHEQAPKTIAFETALKQYREYSTVQNRSSRLVCRARALSVGITHQGSYAAREDYARSHRRRQTPTSPKRGSFHCRQGSRCLEGVFQLVHGAESSGLESSLSGEVLQRRQFAAALSHRGGVQPAYRSGEDGQNIAMSGREDHPLRAHGPAPRQPLLLEVGFRGLPEPRRSDSPHQRAAGHMRFP